MLNKCSKDVVQTGTRQQYNMKLMKTYLTLFNCKEKKNAGTLGHIKIRFCTLHWGSEGMKINQLNPTLYVHGMVINQHQQRSLHFPYNL